MKAMLSGAVLLAWAAALGAQMVWEPFSPVYKGIELTRGTNYPNANNTLLQVVRCFRVDLSDPDVQLFTDPVPTNSSYDTISMTVSNQLKNYGLAIACNADSYHPSTPSSEGLKCTAEGLIICTGRVVSLPDSSSIASLLFTTNKQPSFALTNYPPGVGTTGIFTAVTGLYPVLTNGLNLWTNSALSNALQSAYLDGDSGVHTANPRTVLGISRDKRYLFVMTIDGRQGGYSEGAYDGHSAAWMLAFGAWDAINMDGGGSTSLYMVDCAGNPVAVGHSSYVDAGHERYVGSHFGVLAPRFTDFVYGINAVGGSTAAMITWSTVADATSQVEYGLTSSYGSFSPVDTNLVSGHSVVLTNLTPARLYYFRVRSTNSTGQYASPCPNSFNTTNVAGYVINYGLTNDWKWSASNLDGVAWQTTNYDDSAWSHGPGTLWADKTSVARAAVPSPNTQLPLTPTLYPFVTYYFRTHFNYSGNPAEAVLTFTNHLDDGAAFYLNGVEVYRTNLPAGATNATYATVTIDATPPSVFTLSGPWVTNLHQGDNLVAVEVHNNALTGQDVTFGQTLSYPTPAGVGPVITNVAVIPAENQAVLTWQTLAPGSSQVQYGMTAGLGNSSPLDSAQTTNHTVVLSGLKSRTQYYFRLVSSDGGAPYSYDGTFLTEGYYQPVMGLTAAWRYTTNNVRANNWTSLGYNDAGWLQGNALLYVETNVSVAPRNKALPVDGAGRVSGTYYFRGHFPITNSLVGYALVLTNFIDDGAIFYLNGREIQRVRMPAGATTHGTLATSCALDYCDATEDVPDLFRIGGAALTNIVVGDNVLAVEVHQSVPNDTDVVFGCSIGIARALAVDTKLRVTRSNNLVQVVWDGGGVALQSTATLNPTNATWSDLPGLGTLSPFWISNPPAAARFYRLRDN